MTRLFDIERLTSNEENKSLIDSFSINRESSLRDLQKVVGLESYLKMCAWEDDLSGETRIYLVKYGTDMVAYFGLKAGMISLGRNEVFSDVISGFTRIPSAVPGVEITHFAVNDRFREKYSDSIVPTVKLGRFIFPLMIMPIINDVAEKIGVQIIYLYAAGGDELVKYYMDEFGFEPEYEKSIMTPLKPDYDEDCTFMYKWI